MPAHSSGKNCTLLQTMDTLNVGVFAVVKGSDEVRATRRASDRAKVTLEDNEYNKQHILAIRRA